MANTLINNKKQSFNANDFKESTLNDLLTMNYGKKGTTTRKNAEAKINAITKALPNRLKKQLLISLNRFSFSVG